MTNNKNTATAPTSNFKKSKKSAAKNNPKKPQNQQNLQKFYPIGQKVTKIVNINHNYAKKKKSRTIGVQTPLHGVRPDIAHKRIGESIQSMTTTISPIEITNFEYYDLESMDVDVDLETKKNNDELGIYKKFNELHSTEINRFILAVEDVIDGANLMDDNESAKRKFKEFVGPNHYICRSHFIEALYDATSFEFFTWSRYLRDNKIVVCGENFEFLDELPLTKDFMDKYFGPELNTIVGR